MYTDQKKKICRLKKQLKVKLLIIDNMFQRNQSVRKFLSPILHSFDSFPEFGMVHTALIIGLKYKIVFNCVLLGPWVFDWNKSGLCIPRKCVSNAAIVVSDLEVFSTVTEIKKVLDILSEVIVHWNVNMNYAKQSSDLKKEGNCQDFVMDVLNHLNIKMKLQGPMVHFLSTMKKQGSCIMEFQMDETFQSNFEIQSNVMKFHSHSELDKFVDYLLDRESDFVMHYPGEWSLLKSFDRAFWARYYKNPKNLSAQPFQNQHSHCPFKDPKQTQSFFK